MKGRLNLVDLVGCGRIILKWVLKNSGVVVKRICVAQCGTVVCCGG